MSLHYIADQLKLKDSTLLRDAAFVNGDWLVKDQRFEVSNPSTQQVLARVSNVTESDTQDAIAAAKAAFPAWAAKTAK